METFEKKIDPKWKPPPSGMQVTSSSQGYENAFNMYLRSETKSNKFTTSRLKQVDSTVDAKPKRMPSRKKSR